MSIGFVRKNLNLFSVLCDVGKKNCFMLGCGSERQVMIYILHVIRDVNLNLGTVLSTLPEFFSLALRQPRLKRHYMTISEKAFLNETERAGTC